MQLHDSMMQLGSGVHTKLDSGRPAAEKVVRLRRLSGPYTLTVKPGMLFP